MIDIGTGAPCRGPLAQLAEQQTFNLFVQGSSPWRPTAVAVLLRLMGDVRPSVEVLRIFG